ncbi:polysaccharide lyase family 1 protein [Pedobacter sp. SYSU D00535]|uniref:pectate lyase family protein n=1 Tax=Pedobacter sp. SYSU D00535 TaxID=2810308 RepID=UPI001A96DE1F|nr:right-handed parallel beta-helix repeat-containing protein [Pedobacter sp. SYSU D00535]
MNRKNFVKKISSMTLLLATVILFSQCQKNEGEELTLEPAIDQTETAVSATTLAAGEMVLNVTKAYKDAGYSYELVQDLKTTADSEKQPTASVVRIFENGKELGPGHASHKEIRNTGKGRFSHWGTSLYFSASDNTDPRTNGRRYTYTIGTALATPAPAAPAPAPTAPSTPIATNSPIGYAMVDGKTTGGQGGQTVTVSSLSALKTAAASSAPMIIQVSGTITGTGSVQVKSNKSIIGLKGATLNGVGIKVFGVSNVIIQNLKIQNVRVGTDDNDGINVKFASHHVWIDHCELSADRNHGWEYYDGLIDITRESNYVTVSWTKFRDSHIPLLIGGGIAGHESDRGKLKITLHNNHFYNISERAPDMKYGYVHMFNNYIQNNSGYGVAALAGGTVRMDNNYFANSNRPITTTYKGYPAGYISGANTNIYSGSGSNNITTSASTWLPPYEYKSVLVAAANVPQVVSAGAGPR